MTEESREFENVLRSLVMQAQTRSEALELMTHTLRHMEIYVQVLGSKLEEHGLLKESTVRKLEASMLTAQHEIEELDRTLQKCAWKPHEMAHLIQMRGLGPESLALLARYKEHGCWNDEKRFQIGRVFEATVRKWWGEQKRALREAAHISIHDELNDLFASHYPAGKQYWRMDAETYRERIETAAELVFQQLPKSSSLSIRMWQAAGSLLTTFKHTISTGITYLVRLLRRHWKVALTVTSILAITLASATLMPAIAVAGAVSTVTSGYSATLAIMAPFCPLFYSVEALVGVAYILRVLLGQHESAVCKIADQTYVYKSSTLEQVILALDRSDLVNGWREVLTSRLFHKKDALSDDNEISSQKDEHHLETLLFGGVHESKQMATVWRILYQCIYWANFALSFACASSMNTVQANLGHVDRVRDWSGKAKDSSPKVRKVVDYCQAVGLQVLQTAKQNVSTLPKITVSIETDLALSTFVGAMTRFTKQVKTH